MITSYKYNKYQKIPQMPNAILLFLDVVFVFRYKCRMSITIWRNNLIPILFSFVEWWLVWVWSLESSLVFYLIMLCKNLLLLKRKTIELFYKQTLVILNHFCRHHYKSILIVVYISTGIIPNNLLSFFDSLQIRLHMDTLPKWYPHKYQQAFPFHE